MLHPTISQLGSMSTLPKLQEINFRTFPPTTVMHKVFGRDWVKLQFFTTVPDGMITL